ncbi:SHOCT domain-containing protein [Lactobacillus sp. ESL0261]|nr:SHOCT domain-containing protein [Lactobacillus sp. ESL0261]RMC53310.1 SHOCT domain-containing protein [Lactobacillus sp. ESL0261]
MIAELKQLKELVDEGILTEEEFSAKKKQILGL